MRSHFYSFVLFVNFKLMSRSLPQLVEEGRLLPMLSDLTQRYLGQDFSNRKSAAGNVTANMLDQVWLVCSSCIKMFSSVLGFVQF